jgi:hypothetical protein
MSFIDPQQIFLVILLVLAVHSLSRQNLRIIS